VVLELYVALVEMPPNFKLDLYTTTALDPDQPLQKPGHASPAVWLQVNNRRRGGRAPEHIGWEPLRWAVGYVDGLRADVRLMGPLIATAAKSRRERAFPMTTSAKAREISISSARTSVASDLAWIRKQVAGKEAVVDATVRAKLSVPLLAALLTSQEHSSEVVLPRSLAALHDSRLRRLAVACTHIPSAARCAMLADALPPYLEELSLHVVYGPAVVPTIARLLRSRGGTNGGSSTALGEGLSRVTMR
jgi:hypothetical protein